MAETFKKPLFHYPIILAIIGPARLTMHTLQPKHSLLKPEEVKEILAQFNISISQLPKIKSTDPAIPEGCQTGQVIKIEREVEGKKVPYYRVVV